MGLAGFVTDFADQAVLLPVTVAVGIGFFFSGWRRGALAWSGGIAGTLALVLLLKIVCLACGFLMLDGLRSPSGHTAAAATVLGGFFGLIVRWRGGSWRATVPIASGFAAIIGLSRLELAVHSPVEVVIAGIVGVLGAIAVVVMAGPPPRTLRVRPIAAVAVAVLLALQGFRLPAESRIKDFAALTIWPLSSCHLAHAASTASLGAVGSLPRPHRDMRDHPPSRTET